MGILEYLSQSNNNADFVSESERFKFIDNLTLLEIVNLLSIGLSSFLIRCETSGPIWHYRFHQIILIHKSTWISECTKNQKMQIDESKSKIMGFNFTNNHQFWTRLRLEGKVLDTVSETKLLGTIETNDLKRAKNTSLVKKANKR